ncbi:MAG: FAD-dependent oxidoreductase [Chromatiales bacterium]
MRITRILIGLVVIAWLFAYFMFDLGQYFTLAYFRSQHAAIHAQYVEHPWYAALVFTLIYIPVAATSLPGGALMTLAAGAFFGALWGTVVISIASTIAATITFLGSRFWFRDLIQNKFADSLRSINSGIERDGALYLFLIRLTPLFPFFVVNVVMGLTPIPTLTFIWVSQVGMIPVIAILVNAGTEVAALDDLSGLLSPGLVASLIFLGVLPLLGRKFTTHLRARRLLRRFAKPKQFDCNLICLGGSTAAIVAANAAASMKAKVALIAPPTNPGSASGYVPSKELARCARFLFEAHRAHQRGIRSVRSSCDLADLVAEVQRRIADDRRHEAEWCSKQGIACLSGEPMIVSPYAVKVHDRTLTTRNIVIATGSRTSIPLITGIEKTKYYTADTLLALRAPPRRLLILGGGSSGCELAQLFARLGSQVTVIEAQRRLLASEDVEVSELLLRQFQRDGIDVRFGCRAQEFTVTEYGKALAYSGTGDAQRVEFDALIVACGRIANTRDIGLETLGISVSDNGTVDVDEHLQTIYPNIYACGDVAAPFRFTHEAMGEASYAAFNALFRLKRYKVNYSLMPWSTLTDPEIARIGINEQEAATRAITHETAQYGYDESPGRLMVTHEGEGLIKVLTVPGKDKILGTTIVGPNASQLITEFAVAMAHGIGLSKMRTTRAPYPGIGGVQRQTTVPGWAVSGQGPIWLSRSMERFHTWQRGPAITP